VLQQQDHRRGDRWSQTGGADRLREEGGFQGGKKPQVSSTFGLQLTKPPKLDNRPHWPQRPQAGVGLDKRQRNLGCKPPPTHNRRGADARAAD